MLFHLQKSLFKALLFAIVVLAGNAFAAELITSRAYVVDASAQKSLKQIENEESTPYTGVLSRGYTDAAIWVKLQITPPEAATADDDIVLRIRPVYLDEIRLFDPLDQSGKARTVGDTTPVSANEFASLSHTFVVPAGDKPRAIWLRVKTTSTSLVTVEAFSREDMASNELKLNLVYFGVLAIVGMFALLMLINWVNHRDALYALFIARQIYYFFYVAALFGMHRFVFADMPNVNLNAVFSWEVVLATALSFLFEYRFLNEYSLPRWARVVLNGLMLGSLIVFMLMALGYTRIALQTNMLLNAISLPTWLVISILFIDGRKVQARKDKVLLSKTMVVAYYFSVNAVLVFSFLPYLGFMNGNEFAVNGLVFYTLCSGLFMTALMQLRANKQAAMQADYEKNLMLSEQAVALEKSRREDQTHLFHMLMHELKTPLSVIDMALLAKNDQQTTSSYVSRAVGNMKSILDRCVKADKLTEGSVDIQLTHIDIHQHIRGLLDQKPETAVKLVAAESIHVKTDGQFLTVMLGNLLENAQRYGDAREAIEIVAINKPNDAGVPGVSVTISNRPSTASWPDADMVFKKYYRSRGAESQSGTGLGLYLVRTLARLVGGDCFYVPSEKYVRFELWLPS